MTEILEQTTFPKFIPEGRKSCKGHANHMLDCDYSKVEDRELLSKVVSSYITDEKNISKRKK